MTGAEMILNTAADAGVEVCFANPGTTELAMVAALDRVKRVRPVLGLFEGVCAGAADGYGRIKQKPAMTLLHLGPGLANAIANLHNARRARTPILNVIGDHASWHRESDPPLNMDIAALASTVSGWQKECKSAEKLSADTAQAIAASLYGQIATLMVPSDYQAQNCLTDNITLPQFTYDPVNYQTIARACSLIKKASRPALILGGKALRRPGLGAAADIKAKSGCELLMVTFPACFDSGEGLPVLKRIPYFPQQAEAALSLYDAFILVGAPAPVAFFGYPGQPGVLLPPKAPRVRLDTDRQDTGMVLEELAMALGPAARKKDIRPLLADYVTPPLPDGPLDAAKMCAIIAALQPERCIVVDEGLTSSVSYYAYAPNLKPYTHMTITGGAIGMGMPCALGAALAAPGRTVITIQADGSALYTPQALWSQAREKTRVITVICSNRSYATIRLEYLRAGYRPVGKKAASLMSLDGPSPGWAHLGRSMGVPSASAGTAETFIAAFQEALCEPGPYLIEAILPA